MPARSQEMDPGKVHQRAQGVFSTAPQTDLQPDSGRQCRCRPDRRRMDRLDLYHLSVHGCPRFLGNHRRGNACCQRNDLQASFSRHPSARRRTDRLHGPEIAKVFPDPTDGKKHGDHRKFKSGNQGSFAGKADDS